MQNCKSNVAAGLAQMGEALIRGFVRSGVSTADKLSASVRSSARAKVMRSLGVTVFGNALEGGAAGIAASDIVVLGVGLPVTRNPACLLARERCSATHPHLLVTIRDHVNRIMEYVPLVRRLSVAQVKPMYVRDVLRALAPHVQPERHLIVSIAAGVNLQSIEGLLPAETRVVRSLIRAKLLSMAS